MTSPEVTKIDTAELAEVAWNALEQLQARQMGELRQTLYRMEAIVGTSTLGIQNWDKICDLIRAMLTTVVRMDRIKRFNV